MEFQKGMDLSFIPELEDAGVQVELLWIRWISFRNTG